MTYSISFGLKEIEQCNRNACIKPDAGKEGNNCINNCISIVCMKTI